MGKAMTPQETQDIAVKIFWMKTWSEMRRRELDEFPYINQMFCVGPGDSLSKESKILNDLHIRIRKKAKTEEELKAWWDSRKPFDFDTPDGLVDVF